MYQVNGITNDPKQQHKLLLFNGNTLSLYLEFKPMQLGWFMNLSYLDFSVTGLRVVCSPNILRQFSNVIPFGLACFSADGREPMHIEDFSSGNSELNILTADEMKQLEEYLSG